ncbi:MAG: response regulator [Lachnospiraceae bacterium]|nr:response regulator [Lachnospiraceae bacterium]
MRETFGKWFGLDTPLEVINFNIGMVALSVSYVASFASALYLGIGREFFYITGIGMVLLAFFMGYAAQSGKYQIASFAIVVLLELIICPGAYLTDGRFMSFMLIYYFLGFLLTVFVQDGRLRTLSNVLFWVSWILSVIIAYYNVTLKGKGLYDGMNTVVDVVIPMTICALFAVFSILASLRFYKRESVKAEESRRKADETEKSKDIFLMNMSHEIRTPMNAIMSAGEIMLSRDITEDERQNVHHITNACRALISTLDDLLVFSKAEKRDIVMQEAEYDFGTLLDDIINMISVRLMRSDVKLYVYIDPYIPRTLYGDIVRIRQVFINILNNAVKYTKKGHITLRVVMSDVMTDSMVIHADVKDTGIGIKEEKLPALFDDFARVEDNMNESLKIEGSGLGLSITKNIINSCGGEINVESEYNKGSVFSFDIPQRISDTRPVAMVERSKELGVIICDDDEEMKGILMDTLRAMRIRCVSVVDSVEMNSAIREGIYTHLFITPECLEGSCDLPVLMSADITIVMMRDVDDPDDEAGDARIVKPISCLNIARYFADEAKKTRTAGYGRTSDDEASEARKVMVAGARAMVVEDNMTNLMVAERLLTQMGFDVSTANSGTVAMSLAKVMSFDMMFIDYMMTGMNGVDTLRALRRLPDDWAKSVPCIVLTADAHEGAKQMLINAGFDDYLAKPIDMEELEYMVKRYLPGEKLV